LIFFSSAATTLLAQTLPICTHVLRKMNPIATGSGKHDYAGHGRPANSAMFLP